MQIAIVVHPGFIALDVIGPYEVLGRLPGAEVVFVAESPGLVTNDLGSLPIDVVKHLDEVPAPDVVLVGGGPGQAEQMTDGALHAWLRTVDRSATWMTSVCMGSLVSAAAGVLSARRATTHWGALDQLSAFGAVPTPGRVVIDGPYATGAGVSAGIDMALTLAGRICGDDVAQAVQLLIETGAVRTNGRQPPPADLREAGYLLPPPAGLGTGGLQGHRPSRILIPNVQAGGRVGTSSDETSLSADLHERSITSR